MQTAQNYNYQNNNQNQKFLNRPIQHTQQPMQYVQQPMQYMQQPIQYGFSLNNQNNQNRFPSQPINVQSRQINQKSFTNR